MTRIIAGRARSGHRLTPLSCPSGLGLGTGILTADGELPVEFLDPGDRVVTLDGGFARLARIDVREVPAREVVRVRPAVLDPDGDGREFHVADRQKFLVRDWRARILWRQPAALIEARRMLDGAHMARLEGDTPTRLFQLVFEERQHLVSIAGGRFDVASARVPARAANRP